MRFLHEYMTYADGKKIENGYWEIQGDRLVNKFGGWHFYKPSEDDEIIEADSWRDILKISVRDDTEVTGFVAPDGEFIGCSAYDHENVAEVLFGCSENELMNKGYIKIYEIPKEVLIGALREGKEAYRYEAMEIKLSSTDQQAKTLEGKGFKKISGYLWVMN